jgi:hypothetical protein
MSSLDVLFYLSASKDSLDRSFLLLRRIGQHLTDINISIFRATSSLEDSRHQVTALKICVIMVLSAQLKILRILSKIIPDAHRQCIDMAAEVVTVTQSFPQQDYDLLCPVLFVSIYASLCVTSTHCILQICWAEARDMVQFEQINQSDAPSTVKTGSHTYNLHGLNTTLESSIILLRRSFPW